MNEDILKGKWHQLKGAVKAHWGKLTNDELDRYAGETEKLVGRIQELYGESKEQIVKKLEHLSRTRDERNGHDGCCESPASETAKAKDY